jgi:membrane protease YdiL (CAAX protease family)
VGSIQELIKNNQLKSYFTLTFVVTWVFFVLPLLFSITDPIIAVLVSAIGGSGPALVAIVLSGAIKPKKLEVQNLKRWAIFIILLVLISFLVVLYLGISLNTISITVLILIIVNAVIAAYIITGGLAAHEGIRELLSKLYIWKVGLKWYIVALLIFPVITYLSLIFGVFTTGSPISEILPQISISAIYGAILSFFYITLIRGPLREEIGWRGFALPRLQNLYSPLVATLILAVIWTVWYLPLYYNGMYPGGFDAFLTRFTWNIGLTFLFTWIYNHTRGSLLLVTLFHGSINTAGTLIITPVGISGPYSLAYIVLINIAAIVVIIADKMWRKLPEDHEAVYKY